MENSHDGQSHLQFTVVAHNALQACEENLLERNRVDHGDEGVALAKPRGQVGEFSFATLLRQNTFGYRVRALFECGVCEIPNTVWHIVCVSAIIKAHQ